MTETHEHRLKRIKIRAWRRGIKEMDLLIGGYADAHLPTMTADELDAFEHMMDENDQDLLAWVTHQEPTPAHFQVMLDKVVAFADPKLWLK
ncbi:succinate dehydrogenase assembly factor 2 [Celeribacter marinus]|uniref:succinate dehydrogenase assembly factor 2 n=1 Tax=Celeribacter marinus TaxID=1397108 RepID=UPI003F6B257F